jgi:hypothetical protein
MLSTMYFVQGTKHVALLVQVFSKSVGLVHRGRNYLNMYAYYNAYTVIRRGHDEHLSSGSRLSGELMNGSKICKAIDN